MIKPLPTKVNFLVKSKTETKPLSPITKCVFMIFHIMLFLDFGFLKSTSRRVTMIVKLFTFIQITVLTIFLSYSFFYTAPNSSSSWYCADVLVYYFFGILLLISKNTFHDFLLDLHSFDFEIGADSHSYHFHYWIILGSLLVPAFKILGLIFFCVFYYDEYCDYPKHIRCGYLVTMAGLNTTLLVLTLLFQSVHTRLKKFTLFVKNESTDVVSCHYLYKNIVEITERAKRTFDLIIVIALIYTTIDVTLTIYIPYSQDANKSGYTLHMPLAYVMVIQELIMIFAPAFTAGLVSSEVENLQLALYDRLVKDQNHTKDLKRFLGYINARPLRFKVWMVIPLDWSLPVILVNISVTYLIVMIQFTHKN